jgi:hypothetical protein
MANSELSISVLERGAHSHGVSWSAVIGGAVVTAALSLLMLALGAGFELSTISPWSNVGASAATVGTIAVIWLFVTQILASAMGGYLAGRLRTRWHSLHDDEVHFRDTANGFLTWAVAVVITVAFLASAATTMAGGAAGAREPSVSKSGNESNGQEYFVDRMFRSEHPGAADSSAGMRAEAGRLLAASLWRKDNSVSDNSYLVQLVTAGTGLSQTDAEKRVAETIAEARQSEDTLRKATARLLLLIFLALLCGAFSASYAATIGGRQRDAVKITY